MLEFKTQIDFENDTVTVELDGVKNTFVFDEAFGFPLLEAMKVAAEHTYKRILMARCAAEVDRLRASGWDQPAFANALKDMLLPQRFLMSTKAPEDLAADRARDMARIHEAGYVTPSLLEADMTIRAEGNGRYLMLGHGWRATFQTQSAFGVFTARYVDGNVTSVTDMEAFEAEAAQRIAREF